MVVGVAVAVCVAVLELEPPEAPALGVGGEAAGELRAGAEGCAVVTGEDFGALKPTSWPLWL